MNNREKRRHQMFMRVRDFGSEHTADFTPDSLGARMFKSVAGIVSELDGHAASSSSSSGSAKQGTATRAQARQNLREDMEAISRTARAMADEVTGIEDKFRVPRGVMDQALVTAGRAFAADAVQFSAQFIAHELPADFLTDLKAEIDALDAAMSSQSTGTGQRIAAAAAIDDAIDKGVVAVRKLDAIVKNKYANNPAVLAKWTSASHTEREPRRGEGSVAPPPPPPSSGASGPTPPG